MNISIATSTDFLECVFKLPKSVQQQTIQFIKNYPRNPKASGFNFEKIARAADESLRSVRISKGYRAILKAPRKGSTFLALWVDKHDEAYDWAERHAVDIHPDTGAIQVLPVEVERVPVSSVPQEKAEAALFDSYRDRQLRRVGVPEDLLPLVRSLKDNADLNKYRDILPKNAFECLHFLSDGIPYNEVLSIAGTTERNVDTDDIDAALALPVTQRQFVRIDEALLEEIFHGALEKWRVFLHPEQRRVVEIKANGPVRVLGGAGTGKTVAAIHRAKWLATEVFTAPEDRILFFTFNTNLAADIEKHLSTICPPDVLDRIEVKNLDRWVVWYLYKLGAEFKPVYQDPKFAKSAWKKALKMLPEEVSWPSAWVKDEYQAVIVANGIKTKEAYLDVSRAGRGTRLARSRRMQLWIAFDAYQEMLGDRRLLEPEDMYRELADRISLSEQVGSYRAVIVDEVQDMSAAALRLIRSIVPEGPHDLFIVGDPHQRIYGHPVVLSQCGIRIRGRGRRLRINYRTPEEVRAWAGALLAGVQYDNLDGVSESQAGYVSLLHGEEPTVLHFDSRDDEIKAVVKHIKELGCGDRLHTICLVARTYSQRKIYENGLKRAEIATHQLGKEADDPRMPGVRIATMHRVKGLEFDHLIAAGVQAGTMPLRSSLSGMDQVAQNHILKRERSLLYVVATRVKKTLLVTGHGTKSEFLSDT